MCVCVCTFVYVDVRYYASDCACGSLSVFMRVRLSLGVYAACVTV